MWHSEPSQDDKMEMGEEPKNALSYNLMCITAASRQVESDENIWHPRVMPVNGSEFVVCGPNDNPTKQ